MLNRVLKEGTKVPLFLGQTFLQSLRDVGYNSTTSAICEHVDNAIQAGATDVRVYFHQTGRKGSFDVDVLVYDNGHGMPPHVLQVAMSFGGSMSFDNRKGIGRFGVGMKTAALTRTDVFNLAKAAAAAGAPKRKRGILVTESNGRKWDGLEKA